MATTYWDKVVCLDGSAIQNIEWANIINTPSGTKDIVGTANQISVDSSGVDTIIGLTPTIRVQNIENAQTVSGTSYNTYADDPIDPGVQYFTRLSTFRSTTDVSASASVPVWQFQPTDGHSYRIKIASILHSGASTAFIEREFMVRMASSVTTITNGGMNIIGVSILSGMTTSGTGPITFNIDLAPLVTLTAPVNVTTRIEALETLV